jgi:intergrase/recombinase
VTEKLDKDERGGVVTFQQAIKDKKGKDKAVAAFRVFIANKEA